MRPDAAQHALRLLLADPEERAFACRFAELLVAWVTRLPGLSGAPVLVPWHQALAWREWVTQPLDPWLHLAAPSASILLPDTLLRLFEPADPLAQSAPLERLYLQSQRRRLLPTDRRRRGLVFTPRNVADALVSAVEPLVLPPIEGPIRFLEPSAGAGVFWEALIAHRLAPLEPHARPAAYADLLLTHLFAIERDPLLAALIDVRARAGWYSLQLLQAGLAGGAVIDPPESLIPQVLIADTLDRSALPATWPAQFDVVIGNPPYGYAESIDPDERMRLTQQYAVARGGFDRSWVFCERALQLLRPDGVMALLVPDALLVRPRARGLRHWLAAESRVLQTIDVGTAFPYTSVGGAFLIARRRTQQVPIDAGAVDALFRVHLPPAPVVTAASAIPLGALCWIGRGEELGDRACVPLGQHPDARPILRGRDLAMLGDCVPEVGLVTALQKPAGRYAVPKLMIVKTGAMPIIALDLHQGWPVLQSIYMLHVRAHYANQITLPLLAWLLASPEAQQRFRALTAGKSVFPQLNQQMLARFELPSLTALATLHTTLTAMLPIFCATGVITDEERAAANNKSLLAATAMAWRAAIDS